VLPSAAPPRLLTRPRPSVDGGAAPFAASARGAVPSPVLLTVAPLLLAPPLHVEPADDGSVETPGTWRGVTGAAASRRAMTRSPSSSLSSSLCSRSSVAPLGVSASLILPQAAPIQEGAVMMPRGGATRENFCWLAKTVAMLRPLCGWRLAGAPSRCRVLASPASPFVGAGRQQTRRKFRGTHVRLAAAQELDSECVLSTVTYNNDDATCTRVDIGALFLPSSPPCFLTHTHTAQRCPTSLGCFVSYPGSWLAWRSVSSAPNCAQSTG